MRKFIEIMWMVIAAVSAIEMIVGYKKAGFQSEDFQIFGLLFVASAFMYFFRKRQRMKIQNRKDNPS